MTDYQAIIFDLDGVIIHSEPLHEEAQRIVFSRFALDVPPSAFQVFKGQTEEAVFAYVVETYADDALDPAALVALKHRVFEDLMERLQPVAGVLPFLERLARRGHRLGLTTSATRSNQQRAFDMFGLAPYFDAVVTAADVTRPKPDPEPYLKTAERLHAAPERCLVFEDSTHGVRSARRAGCTVAGLTTSFSAAQLTEAGASFTAGDFDELARHPLLAPLL